MVRKTTHLVWSPPAAVELPEPLRELAQTDSDPT